jgi:ABC-type uncharacterized transport system ATPase subunit
MKKIEHSCSDILMLDAGYWMLDKKINIIKYT